MRVPTPLMLKGAAALLFWLAIFLRQKLNYWGLGGGHALVLLALLVAAGGLTIAAQRSSLAISPTGLRLVTASAAVLMIAQIIYAAVRLARPHLSDIAMTTLAAGKVLLAGGNPYLVPLDPQTVGDGTSFAGYKYLPAMALAYLPLGAPLGSRGVPLANLLLQLGVVWAMIRIATEIGSRSAGWVAATLYLSLPLLPFQLFAKGVTDLAAVLPLLIALALSERHALAAGLCIGLSISAKPLPGALLAPICLPAAGRARLAYGWSRHRSRARAELGLSRPRAGRALAERGVVQPGAARRCHELAIPDAERGERRVARGVGCALSGHRRLCLARPPAARPAVRPRRDPDARDDPQRPRGPR